MATEGTRKKQIDTMGMRITFGKYGQRGGALGQLVTRLPVSYLKWMVATPIWELAPDGLNWSEIAAAELERRGTTTPEIVISGHAIDRASLRILSEWQNNHRDGEGLYSWLVRMAQDALEKGSAYGEKIDYAGIYFIFAKDSNIPVLKSIMNKK